MKFPLSFKSFVFLMSFFVLASSSPLLAKPLSYDPYAAETAPQETPSIPIWKHLVRLPTYPFRLLKWPVDETLMAVEKHRLDKKSLWIYNQLQNHGMTPHFNFVNVRNQTWGADFDFVRMAQQKHHFPDLIIGGRIKYSEEFYFGVGGDLGWERIRGSDISVVGSFDYERRHQEHFYGIGPDTSRGEGFVYGMETTRFKPVVRYEPSTTMKTELFMSYQNININGGKDGGRGQIGEGLFNEAQVPGFHGDSLLSYGIEWMHDTRNQKENSTQGGYQRLGFHFNEGIDGSAARYFTYLTELAQYLRLGNERRVLALHFYGEHNDAVNGQKVPFHQMPRLGGYGSFPRLSHPLRSYDFNRFTDQSVAVFNIEYRYNIWEYRHFKADTVFFFDSGAVFDEFSNFQFKDFRESYGGGLRISIANIPVLSIEAAHGDEGTRFYVRTKTPF